MFLTLNSGLGFPVGPESKESACNAGYLGLASGLGRSPGEEKHYHSSIHAWRIPWTEETEIGRAHV